MIVIEEYPCNMLNEGVVTVTDAVVAAVTVITMWSQVFMAILCHRSQHFQRYNYRLISSIEIFIKY